MKYYDFEKKLIKKLGKIEDMYKIFMWVWVAIWVLLALGYVRFSNLDGYDLGKWAYNLFFFIPALFGFLTLWWNYRLILIGGEKVNQGDKYTSEVDLIEFVERNSNYIILGITALLFASGFFMAGGKSLLRDSFFLFFLGLSLIMSICGVLPLIWMPYQKEAIALRWLRHFKTIWYSFSIYLFLAGIISMGKVWFFEYLSR